MPFHCQLTFASQDEDNEQNCWAYMPGLHRYLFVALANCDPSVADCLHVSAQKPFTLTLLRPVSQGLYHTRLAVLDDSLYDSFVCALQGTLGQQFEFRHRPFVVRDLQLRELLSYEEIWKRSRLNNPFLLDFCSPTAFKQQDRYYLFPEGTVVFRSIISRWNRYAS